MIGDMTQTSYSLNSQGQSHNDQILVCDTCVLPTEFLLFAKCFNPEFKLFLQVDFKPCMISTQSFLIVEQKF